MKKYILMMLLLFTIGAINAQIQVDSIIAKQKIKIHGYNVTGVSNDIDTANKDSSKVMSEAATKNMIISHSGSSFDTSKNETITGNWEFAHAVKAPTVTYTNPNEDINNFFTLYSDGVSGGYDAQDGTQTWSLGVNGITLHSQQDDVFNVDADGNLTATTLTSNGSANFIANTIGLHAGGSRGSFHYPNYLYLQNDNDGAGMQLYNNGEFAIQTLHYRNWLDILDGVVSFGDLFEDVNATKFILDDNDQSINLNANNGYTFNGGLVTFNDLSAKWTNSDGYDVAQVYSDGSISFDGGKISSNGTGVLNANGGINGSTSFQDGGDNTITSTYHLAQNSMTFSSGDYNGGSVAANIDYAGISWHNNNYDEGICYINPSSISITTSTGLTTYEQVYGDYSHTYNANFSYSGASGSSSSSSNNSDETSDGYNAWSINSSTVSGSNNTSGENSDGGYNISNSYSLGSNGITLTDVDGTYFNVNRAGGAYFAGGNFHIHSDGSGDAANGSLSWDVNGNLTVNKVEGNDGFSIGNGIFLIGGEGVGNGSANGQYGIQNYGMQAWYGWTTFGDAGNLGNGTRIAVYDGDEGNGVYYENSNHVTAAFYGDGSGFFAGGNTQDYGSQGGVRWDNWGNMTGYSMRDSNYGNNTWGISSDDGSASFKSITYNQLTTSEINLLPQIEGLQVYNSTLHTICFYNGTSWQKVSSTNMN